MASAVVTEHDLDDGTLIVDLHGELDIAVNDGLRDILVDKIRSRRPPRIVVNMRHVAFVDSTGIGALLAAHNVARAVGVHFEVREMAPFVERQLHVAEAFDSLVSHRR